MPNPASSGLTNPASYDTSHDAVVIDLVTRLTWQGTLDDQQFAQADAAGYCDGLVRGGFDDWRLPSRLELVTLLDFTVAAPAIDREAFPNAPYGPFWTSTPTPQVVGGTWQVDFDEGQTLPSELAATARVRCVRGAPYVSSFERGAGDLADTVFDHLTGLTWQRGDSGHGEGWSTSAAVCDSLDLAGSNDWRVPSIKELHALIDDSRASPALDTDAFTYVDGDYYFWSSSRLTGSGTRAWIMFVPSGAARPNYYPDQFGYHLRCVR